MFQTKKQVGFYFLLLFDEKYYKDLGEQYWPTSN